MLRDNEMRRLAEVMDSAHIKVMYTLHSYVRGDFGDFRYPDGSLHHENDQLFINSHLNFIDTVLNRFGPNGIYFQENPSIPYQPILYVEMLNEPSLHYFIDNHGNFYTLLPIQFHYTQFCTRQIINI